MMRILVPVLFLLALALPAAAAADSLVYIKDHNVWLSNPDGSSPYQVTLDGTAGAPYETPSQSDAGVVVAIRQTPGQRRQIYRMTQSGGLLNPPINTPAPGSGAIDGKVSPDGALVAYWFVTTVQDPFCPFCVNVSSRALLSRSDRFTNADEVGTPNGGGWPSWVSNSTITLGSGSSTQWYYSLGMAEMAEWFTGSEVTAPSRIQSLLDAEAAPTGNRLAVVEGDSQETIRVVQMNGPPPTKPTIPNPNCPPIQGPNGKFVDPTWSSDGGTLAWQENDGIWTIPVPANLADCIDLTAQALRIPGARNPDLSPAGINPGPRPGCGNPGNPTACTGGGNTVGGDQTLGAVLNTTLAAQVRALGRLRIGRLLRRRGFSIVFDAPGPGTLTVQLTASGAAASTVIARGRRVFRRAGRATVKVKLTRKGVKRLRRARRLRATLRLSFTPTGGRATTVRRRVTLRR